MANRTLPLIKSKTTWLGGLTLVGLLGMLSEVRSAVSEVSQYLPYVLVIFGALVVLNRWNEHRRALLFLRLQGRFLWAVLNNLHSTKSKS